MSRQEVLGIALMLFGFFCIGHGIGEHRGYLAGFREGYREGRRRGQRFAVHRSRHTSDDPLEQTPLHTHN